MSFVHLHLHTEYSLVDSVVRITSETEGVPGLMEAVARAGMPAVALTDQSNLFAMVKFYKAAQQAGVKPIIGVDLLVREYGDRAAPSRLVLLCQNDVGYKNLTRLVSRSYLEGQLKGVPTIDRSWLSIDNLAGLIALSGAREGDIGRALTSGHDTEARLLLNDWLKLFGNRFYIELQRTSREHEESYLRDALELAGEAGVPVVATNDVRFIRRDDFEAHEARVCIQDGQTLDDPKRPRKYTDQQYLRTPAEMQALFKNIPEALANSVEIARRCSLELKLGKSVLPAYPVPDGSSIEDYLRAESARGLVARLEKLALLATAEKPIVPEVYHTRLDVELGVICQMGFAGYFLIVADFIRWARENGVPVGPGRGSGAGSLVAYALGITDLDPLAYDLLFERFLNPERVSMPDFDVDFCMDGRDRVIEYVAQRYGRDRVSQIITYGTMAAKAVVRDVARVYGHGYGFADSISKLIPFELGITLKDALAKEEELRRRYHNEEETRAVLDMAMSLEGLVRNAGMHAGGVVIAPSVLTDFAPLFCDENGTSVVTQFDKDDVELAGLVKFDFLGLRTLTIIDWAVKTINREREGKGQPPLDVSMLPTDDPAAFDLLKRWPSETTAIFQLESRGMKDLVKRLQPDCFEDIVALVALFRPGPLQSGMVDDFIARKHGKTTGPIDYLHPDLTGVMTPTYGVILYQEQVMQIAQVLAGYSLGGADLLRRAMGKKKPEEMAKQRSIFVTGATGRGVEESVAAHIFDLMEKFAGYGFNKSHSAAYALLSYQTAWLKAHYPAAFMAAVLSSDMDKTEKVVTLIDEARRMRLKVEPPDVNHSNYMFTVSGERGIRYGLGAIKGVGQAVIETIVADRAANGPFRDLTDLCRRSDATRINRRVLEALIRSGATDGLGQNRATLMHALPQAMQIADQTIKARAVGQNDMFGLMDTSAEAPAVVEVEVMPDWSQRVRLDGERDTLGLYLTGHPFEEYEAEVRPVISGRISEVTGDRPVVQEEGFRFRGKPATVAGMVFDLGKRGSRMIVTLDDRSGRIEVSMFEDVYQQYRSIIAKSAILIVEGSLRFDEFIDGWRLTAKRVLDLDQAREQHARRLLIRMPRQVDPSFIKSFEQTLRPFRGGRCSVAVRYHNAGARADLILSDEWSVKPARELTERLSQLVGHDGVRLIYQQRFDA
jgi:DNA polymerase-3 subunit alpha